MEEKFGDYVALRNQSADLERKTNSIIPTQIAATAGTIMVSQIHWSAGLIAGAAQLYVLYEGFQARKEYKTTQIEYKKLEELIS